MSTIDYDTEDYFLPHYDPNMNNDDNIIELQNELNRDPRSLSFLWKQIDDAWMEWSGTLDQTNAKIGYPKETVETLLGWNPELTARFLVDQRAETGRADTRLVFDIRQVATITRLLRQELSRSAILTSFQSNDYMKSTQSKNLALLSNRVHPRIRQETAETYYESGTNAAMLRNRLQKQYGDVRKIAPPVEVQDHSNFHLQTTLVPQIHEPASGAQPSSFGQPTAALPPYDHCKSDIKPANTYGTNRSVRRMDNLMETQDAELRYITAPTKSFPEYPRPNLLSNLPHIPQFTRISQGYVDVFDSPSASFQYPSSASPSLPMGPEDFHNHQPTASTHPALVDQLTGTPAAWSSYEDHPATVPASQFNAQPSWNDMAGNQLNQWSTGQDWSNRLFAGLFPAAADASLAPNGAWYGGDQALWVDPQPSHDPNFPAIDQMQYGTYIGLIDAPYNPQPEWHGGGQYGGASNAHALWGDTRLSWDEPIFFDDQDTRQHHTGHQ